MENFSPTLYGDKKIFQKKKGKKYNIVKIFTNIYLKNIQMDKQLNIKYYINV